MNVIPLRSSTMNATGAWRLAMQAEGKSKRTITERLRLLAAFEAETGTPAEDITARQIMDFLSDPALAQSSRGAYFAVFRAWCGYLVRSGQRADDPTAQLRAPKVPSGTPHPVSQDDLARLLAVPMWPSTKAMILLAAYAGLRVHEIAKIRGEDVHGDELRVHGKGGRVDYLPLHPVLQELAEQMPQHGWWFPSPARSTQHVKRASVSDAIGRAMRRAGVKGSAHWLRHYYGTQLLLTGADIRTVQELMRHASLQTTARYTAVTDERRRAAVARLVA